MTSLKAKMAALPPLEDEPNWPTDDETIVRYLKSSGWDAAHAERRLLASVEWRRENRPLRAQCQWCTGVVGYHSMRQVGHDESGRPVVYACFSQAATHRNTVADLTSHVVALIESAKASITRPGASAWVFVIDCSGMTLSACNPRLGRGVMDVMARHYPERLGMVVCLNHSPLFTTVWRTMRGLLTPTTASKVRMVTSDAKAAELFATFFPEDLAQWLTMEVTLNRRSPLPQSQKEFWNAPEAPGAHDPRGCPSYIRDFVAPFSPGLAAAAAAGGRHIPHPCIVTALRSRISAVPVNPAEEAERLLATKDTGAEVYLTSSEDEEEPIGAKQRSSRGRVAHTGDQF